MTIDIQKIDTRNSITYRAFAHTDVIRLISLCPGEQDENITFSVFHAGLEANNLKYEALSYVWGDEFDRGDVTLTQPC